MKKFRERIQKALIMLVTFACVCLDISPVAAFSADDDNANDNETYVAQSIESFMSSFVSGADLTDGKYVWTVKNSAAGHKFTFRVAYSFSGEGTLDPGSVIITIPKHILKDRTGNFADKYDLAIPSKDEADDNTNFYYIEDGDNIVIKNQVLLSAAENGYIEVSYETTKKTFDYIDMAGSDPFKASIDIIKNGETLSAQSEEIPVYIDTAAKITSTSKSVVKSDRPYTSWDSSWGEKPSDADDYYYIVWLVRTDISNPTQPYNFSINDVFDEKDAEIVGYKMSGSSVYSDINEVYNVKSTSRYDYVLTRHLKKTYDELDIYTLTNKVNATVTPVDGVDAPTYAASTAKFTYLPPAFIAPIGNFWSWKVGNDNWWYYHNRWDVADYGLDDFKKGFVDSIDNDLKYEVAIHGHPYPWTLEDGANASDPYAYGKSRVEYIITDDTFYLDDSAAYIENNLDNIENGKAVIPEGSRQLTYEDYDIMYVDYNYIIDDADFDEAEQKHVAKSAEFNDKDVFHFYGKFGDSDEWVEVGTYNLGTGKADYDSKYVRSLTSSRIEFIENCTGYRISTKNAYYYTLITATPYCRLKNSEYVMSEASDKNKIWITNISNGTVNDSKGETIFYRDCLARDYIIGVEKESSINKSVTSTSNNKNSRIFTIGWKVSVSESYYTNDGKEYVVQDSGKYYDLLPLGAEIDTDTVSVYTEAGELDRSEFDITTVFNYNGTGRTMLIVNMKEQANYYNLTYSTKHSWESIIDYGKSIRNSVAYETGNDKIAGGYPDNGGNIVEKDIISDLDKDTDAEKFLYAQQTYIVDILTAATSGLNKKVKASTDADYSYETTVKQNGDYAYRLRYATTAIAKAKGLVLFDSIENFVTSDGTSDFHGALQSVNVSQLKEMGIAPVVYYSTIANLDINAHHDLTEEVDGVKVWQTESEIGDLSLAKAVAIDMRKDVNGEDYVLDFDSSVSVIMYMKAPENDETTSSDPIAYNNIFIDNTMINLLGGEIPFFIHQDYTKVHFRIMGNLGIYKANATDNTIPVKGISFRLNGTSDYGTEVDKIMTTDKYGHLKFTDIEKGTYQLSEYEGNSDYQMNIAPMTVVIDGNGNVTVDGVVVKDGDYYTINNEPRVHTDLKFYKKDLVNTRKVIEGVTFKLSGTSDYGNDIIMYATSNEKGCVTFGNVELGKYKMVEIETAGNYILSGNTYDIVVDDNGNYSISGTETDKAGNIIIYNEPLHSFGIQKEGFSTGIPIKGATFRLTGTSDYGTTVNEEKTTVASGKINFSELEPGSYILQETDTDDGYVLDDTKRIVTIDKYGKVTISGCENENGYFVVKNKENGFVTITKKWVDTKTNEERPVPVLHISSEIPEQAAYFIECKNGESLLSYYKVTNTAVKGFRPYDSEVDDEDVEELIANGTAVKIDDGTTEYSIYAWADEDGIVKWWTSAKVAYLTDKANKIFYQLTQCEFIDATGINTSKLTKFNEMFKNCWALKSVDLSHFDTSNAINMNSMFYSCSNLTDLDVSDFDTSNVTAMNSMFYFCSNLTDLDVSNFDTSNVTAMNSMFQGCSKLTDLDVSNFDTSKVTNMNSMFTGCSGLTDIDVSDFDTSNVTSMNSMFQNCLSLTDLDVSNFDTSKVTNMANMFYNCQKLTDLDVSNFDTSNVTNMAIMFYNCQKLTDLDVSNFDTSNVTNMANMFYNCQKLTDIDVSDFDTSNVTAMNSMFSGCSGLTDLDVSNFDTSNVTAMNGMFARCSKLTELEVTNFDTSNVTNMDSMFSGCSILTNLDVSNFDTSNVTNMDNMFSGCSILTDLDVSNFDTSNVTNMGSMFSGCSGLTDLDVSNFDTSNVTSMNSMFQNCSSLTNLDVSNFDTSNVIYMNSMFQGCSKLTDLDVSKFNTSNVTNMANMFYNCQKLTDLDISNFDTSKVTNMSYMFSGCINLVTIYASDLWNTDKVTTSVGMFTYDRKLCGGNGTTYDSSNVDSTYARIDTSDESGYFTYKAASNRTNHVEPTSFKQSEEKLTLSAAASVILAIQQPDKMPAETELQTLEVPVADEPKIVAAANKSSSDIEYLSTDGEHCTIEQIDENTWTYTFEGLDPTLDYFVWEDDLEGYISTNPKSNYLEITDGKGTITNTSTEEAPTFGSLKVSKTVEGENLTDEDKARTFLFTVTLTDKNGEALTGTKIYGDTIFTNGIATFRLKGGDSVTVTDIPTGYKYTVTETVEEGFEPSADKLTGTIAVDETAEAAFTNTKNYTQEDNTGFTLKKVVTGNYEIDTDKYEFYVTLENLRAGETYTLSDGTKFTADSFGGASVKVALGNGESVEFKDIPVGSKYRVTEEAGEYTASYLVEDSQKLGLINNERAVNTKENTVLSTAFETADKDEHITITFTNERNETENLTLKKLLENASDNNSDSFLFRVKLSGLDSFAKIKASFGMVVADSDGVAEVDVSLAANEEIMFYDLPVGSKYVVTEAESEYIASYTIEDSNGIDKISSSTGANTAVKKTLSTEEETVNEGESATVTFTNRKVDKELTVTKHVDMTYGNESDVDFKSQEFDFKVVMNGLEESTRYKVEYTDVDVQGITKTVEFASNAAGDAELNLTLKDGESFSIKALPTGAAYQITEIGVDHYISSYKASGNDNAVIIRESAENETSYKSLSTAVETVDPEDIDVSFVFTNTYTANGYVLPNSGLEDSRSRMIMLASALIVCSSVYFISSRKKKGKKA